MPDLWLFAAIMATIVSGSSAGHRKRRPPRTRDEITRERQALEQRTNTEIDELVADAQTNRSRQEASAIGCIYARYSTRHQDSVADQVRVQLEDAAQRGIFVPRENIFFDLAIKGFKAQRNGLDQVRDLLSRRNANVLFLFATNRLFRKVYRTLEFVDQVHREWGIRVIFVKSGVDTDSRKEWEMLLHVHSIMDQFVVSMYADNVRAAHEGLMSKCLVFGTVSFGYAGEPIPGEMTRRGRPRCRLVIDDEDAAIVRQIFDWYVSECHSVEEIARKLNDIPNVPLPPRTTSGRWSRGAVRRVLTNTRYRGCWRYGVTESVFLPSRDYSRQTTRDEPLREIKLEALRIVSDQTWLDARRRLDANEERRRRTPVDGDRQSRPQILNGFFWCPEHNRPLYVAGAGNRSMVCPACRGIPAARRPLFSFLNRQLALRRTCEVVESLIRNDDELVVNIIHACQQYVASREQPDAARAQALRNEADRLTRTIEYNMRQAGLSDFDQVEVDALLRDLRKERENVRIELESLDARAAVPLRIPDEKELRPMIASIADTLLAAANSADQTQQGTVREILRLITGGRIELSQQGEPQHHRGWLRGRFEVRLVESFTRHLLGHQLAGSEPSRIIEIDYRERSSLEKHDPRVWAWLQENVPLREIGRRLDCSRSYVTRIVKHCYHSRGLEAPDGRSLRRNQPPNDGAQYVQLGERAWRLWTDGKSFRGIGRSCGVTDTTVKKAVEYWCRQNNLSLPNVDTRRQRSTEQAMELINDGMSLQDVAQRMGKCVPTVRKWIKDWHAARGTSRPDLRTRK